jgi:8-oxo-dGTP pyrophosphatase MutT (NUDIX family)
MDAQQSRQQSQQLQQWNGGLLCCAVVNNQLHCLLGIEYRSTEKLREKELKDASHVCESSKRALQLTVPGGKFQTGETVLDTVVREFWEETAQIVDRDALRADIVRNGCGFYFAQGQYHLTVLISNHTDEIAVDRHFVRRFHEKVLAEGYPEECSLQLHWIPWSVLSRASDRKEAIALESKMLEPFSLRAPLSFWTRHTLLYDQRVCGYLDHFDYLAKRSQRVRTAASSSTKKRKGSK